MVAAENLLCSKQKLFLAFHRCESIQGKRSLSDCLILWFLLTESTWYKFKRTELWEKPADGSGIWARSHVSLATSQVSRTWHMVSWWSPHRGHVVSKLIPLDLNLSLTASAPERARHRKCLSFGDVFVFQRSLHSFFSRGGRGCGVGDCNSCMDSRSLYPLLES